MLLLEIAAGVFLALVAVRIIVLSAADSTQRKIDAGARDKLPPYLR